MDIMDIRDLKQRETEQALLAAIVSSSEDAIVSKNLDGIVTSWNQAAERIYGWKAEEIIGKSKALVIPPQLPNELAFILAQIQAGERIAHYETQRLRKDGRLIDVAISVSPVKDTRGQIIGAATIVRDTTHQRLLEVEQARLAAIVSSSEDAIVSKDLDGIVTSWNQSAERIYGWKAEEIIGKSKALVIPPQLPDELSHILRQVRAGEKIEHYETQRLRKDGRLIDVAISVSPIKTLQGQVIGAATIVRDITERRSIEHEIRMKHAEVHALNDRLRRAMIETHHRVKNNLQVIAAMIEMQTLEHKAAKTIPLEDYQQLKAHIHTLAIIHDLLSTHIKEDEDAQRVSVKAVLDQLLPMLEQTAWNKAVHYSIEDARVTSKMCISLALILNELVANALKHGNKEAGILFQVCGANALLAVSDDGAGFPAEFDPMQAAHMGLELVESLVRTDLKGRSTYSSRPEGGARVVVTFLLPPNEK